MSQLGNHLGIWVPLESTLPYERALTHPTLVPRRIGPPIVSDTC